MNPRGDLDEYLPKGPAESARIRSFAEDKLRELLSSREVLNEKSKFMHWMSGLTNEILGIEPKKKISKQEVQATSELIGEKDIIGRHSDNFRVKELGVDMKVASHSSLHKLQELRENISSAMGLRDSSSFERRSHAENQYDQGSLNIRKVSRDVGRRDDLFSNRSETFESSHVTNGRCDQIKVQSPGRSKSSRVDDRSVRWTEEEQDIPEVSVSRKDRTSSEHRDAYAFGDGGASARHYDDAADSTNDVNREKVLARDIESSEEEEEDYEEEEDGDEDQDGQDDYQGETPTVDIDDRGFTEEERRDKESSFPVPHLRTSVESNFTVTPTATKNKQCTSTSAEDAAAAPITGTTGTGTSNRGVPAAAAASKQVMATGSVGAESGARSRSSGFDSEDVRAAGGGRTVDISTSHVSPSVRPSFPAYNKGKESGSQGAGRNYESASGDSVEFEHKEQRAGYSSSSSSSSPNGFLRDKHQYSSSINDRVPVYNRPHHQRFGIAAATDATTTAADDTDDDYLRIEVDRLVLEKRERERNALLARGFPAISETTAPTNSRYTGENDSSYFAPKYLSSSLGPEPSSWISRDGDRPLRSADKLRETIDLSGLTFAKLKDLTGHY